MNKINDNLLINLAEGNLKGIKKKEIERLIKTNKSIKKRYDKYKRTLLLLNNFGKRLEIRKETNKPTLVNKKPKIIKSTNIIKIADFLAKKAV
jgi:hypothetical protein